MERHGSQVSSSARSQRWITKRMCLLRYGLQFWDVPSDEYRAVEAPVFKNTHVAILTFTLLKKHTYATPRPVMLWEDTHLHTHTYIYIVCVDVYYVTSHGSWFVVLPQARWTVLIS